MVDSRAKDSEVASMNHKTAFIAVGLVAVLGVMLIAGCGGGGGESTVPEPSSDQTTKSETLKVGEEFVVELESNPSTGYDWTVTTKPDDTILGLTGDNYEPSDPAMPGAPGNRVWRYKALKAGDTKIVYSYARSFEPDVPPIKTHTVTVEVQ